MKRVSIESPYAGNVSENILYAKRCMVDSIARGEAPFASHLLYPGVLDDKDRVQRALGLKISHCWREKADLIAIYTDLGISSGMQEAIDVASNCCIPIEYRRLENGI